MKSSVAVFSNQGDPFPTQTRTRTHYRPSPPHTLTEEQKQTVLSPERFRSLPRHLGDALGTPDLDFLVGSQRLVPGLPGSDSSEPFDESWPSTDSSSKTPEREEGLTDKERGPGSEESVLARYVARFRSGRPTSRRERSPPSSGLKEFWWLQESSEGPEVLRFRPDSGSSGPLHSSPHHLEKTPTLEESSLNDSRLCPEDVDVVGLQLRAGKLIERSVSSLSSAGPVSSEGLGSSPVSTVSSSQGDSGRMRPPPDTAPVLHPSFPSMKAPEEDILYQWRLRRKMEQAREGTLPAASCRRSPSPPVRIPRQVIHTQESTHPFNHVSPQGAAQSTSPHPTSHQSLIPVASPSLTPSHVPPHLHLQCDILPCPHCPSAPGVPRVTQETVRPGPRHSEEGALRPGPRHSEEGALRPGPRHSEEGALRPGPRHGEEGALRPGPRHGEEGALRPGPRHSEEGALHPGPRHSEEGAVCPGPRHGEEGAVRPGPRQNEEGAVRPGPRHSEEGALHPGPRHSEEGAVRPGPRHSEEGGLHPGLLTPPERQMEERKMKPKGGRRRDQTDRGQEGPARSGGRPIPESPVHRALGQVISERLFSPKAKSEKRKTRPSRPSTEDESNPQPLEIAAYLLEEAEDSDGADFADDPLLQVLRDQRESLRARLRAVDSRLTQLDD